ncbi:hypothetical protein JW992_02080 [candidate division KSB1 bacterium]|nr:hypothetical protein [candidate division KSB1 bacterium]
MNKRWCILALLLPLLAIAEEPKSVQFTATESESMLFLYNQTVIRGSDVEIMAPLQSKLVTAFETSKEFPDSTKIVELDLSLQQIELCMMILQQSDVEARYAPLLNGILQKLEQSGAIVSPGQSQP